LVEVGGEWLGTVECQPEVAGLVFVGKLPDGKEGVVGIGRGPVGREFEEVSFLGHPQSVEGDRAAVAVNLDKADAVGVLLVAAYVQGTARIADSASGVDALGLVFVVVAKGLGAVDMAEGHVVEAVAQLAGVDSLEVADFKVVAGIVHARYSHVSHEYHRFLRRVALRYAVEDGLHGFGSGPGHEREGHDVALGQGHDVVVLPAVGQGRGVGSRGQANECDVPHFPYRIVGLDA